jgi:hypothetical protein
MILRYVVALSLFAPSITSSIAATPEVVDSTSNAGDQTRPLGNQESLVDQGWIYLIGSDGPKGIANVGKNVTSCGDVRMQPESRELTAVPGVGVVAALSKTDYGDDNNLLSQQEFGDCEVYLEFLLGKGSNSGVKLQQRYEIQLYDSHGKEKPSGTDCGGIYPHWLFRSNGRGLNYIDQGIPPLANAAKPAGQWQTLHIVFTAPRFDDQGKKTKNARFVSVTLNDQEIHRDVEVDSPTGNASSPLPEVPKAALYLQLDHGPVGFRNVRVKPL